MLFGLIKALAFINKLNEINKKRSQRNPEAFFYNSSM